MTTKTNTNEKTEQTNSKVTATMKKELDAIGTISGKIRYLDSKGLSRGEIAKAVNRRYQHVRNVLITPVSKPKAQ